MAYIAYKFRAYPNISTQKRMIRTMCRMAEIWNAGLKERQESFAASKENADIKPINSYFKQYHLIRKREHPEYADLNAQSMQDVLVKLDGSYKSFFNLIKKDPTARPPKEKDFHPVLVYRQSGWKVDGTRLNLRNIGSVKMRMHREIAGTIKTVTVRVKNRKWYVCFSCEIPDYPAPKACGKEVTITFGQGHFLSDGNRVVKHPEFYFESIEKLRRLSRSLSRKKKGSKNRRRAKYLLHKHHEHVAAKRLYFLHDLANWYVERYGVIRIPKLPLKEQIMQATTSRTAMRLCDAAYGIFCGLVKQKAEKNGVTVNEYAL